MPALPLLLQTFHVGFDAISLFSIAVGLVILIRPRLLNSIMAITLILFGILRAVHTAP